MPRLTQILIFSCVIALGSVAAIAQGVDYSNPNVDYTLNLPSSAWHVIAEPDSAQRHAEFIYGDRSDGYLQVHKQTVEPGTSPASYARFESDQKLRFRPGYVEGRTDNFAGNLKGVVFAYEYTNGGKPMAGRTYYLQADSRTIYILRFTGERDKLARIRNQTDSIARSLKLK